MDERYIIKNGKKLRRGFTTGSCAAGAAKAAVMMLLNQKPVPVVTIDTPVGLKLDLKIIGGSIRNSSAQCAVQKDAGDDPDVTDGIKIYAKAEKNQQPEIKIIGGTGIGTVTRKGLPIEIGNSAINPVPLRMIRNEIGKVLPAGYGVTVEISAPDGQEIANKTYNPELGIIGGISILGTTGIVEPMSEEALKDSLALKLAMMQAEKIDTCIFTPGNYGCQYITGNYRIPAGKIAVTSNFIGFMLEQALHYKIRKILLVGYIGKLIKLAGGIFQTHNRLADARKEILAANYGYYTGDIQTLKKIMDSNTTEEAVLYIENQSFFDFLSRKIKNKCEAYIKNEINLEVILLSQNKGLLSAGIPALKLLETIKGGAG
jgi:cobalt-precorrin-5B (C1)-methyltransferase